MKKLCVACAFTLAAFLPQIHGAWGRPVSHKGGWTVMQMHNAMNTSVHLHYSPSARHSVGLRGFHARGRDTIGLVFQLNSLLKRLNRSHSQANLYLKLAAGGALKNGDLSPAVFAGISADWENRRFFVRYENRARSLGRFDKRFWQSGRVGIAPYVADYGSLHTWIMTEITYCPTANCANKTEITPLVRFFKGASLLEVGYGSKGNFLLNFIRRF